MNGIGEVDDGTGKYSQALDIKPALESHMETDFFQCHLCEFSFDDQKRLKEHLVTHIVDKPFKCEQCEVVFKKKELYETHVRMHAKEHSNYRCTKCDKVFTNGNKLNAHMKVHQWEESNHISPAEKPMQEGNQGQNDQMVTVIKDVQGQVTPKTEKAHQCMKCSRCFKTMEELCEHTEDHCRDKPKKGDYEVNNHLPI